MAEEVKISKVQREENKSSKSRVWSIGKGNHGELGNDNRGREIVPYHIRSLNNIVQVSAG